MSANAPQLFIIPKDLIDSLTMEELDSTVKDLKELGLFRLPYPTVDIQVPADSTLKCSTPDGEIKNFGPDGILTMYGISTEPDAPFKAVFTWECNPRWKGMDLRGFCLDAEFVRNMFCELLVVVLSIKNTVKTTREHKCVKLGIGKNKGRHRYITTISLPKEMERESVPSGREVCAHMRRGHIRRQHYGPRNSFVKNIWIEPVLVNADKEWVKSREAYNLSIPTEAIHL